jgi:hypothetical protein
MSKRTEGRRPWVFTFSRKQALRKAQKKHAYLVNLGERAYQKGMR